MSDSKQALQEKIKRLERDLAEAVSDSCRTETARVIQHLQEQLAEQK